MALHQLLAQVAGGTASFRIKDRQNESEDKENGGKPPGEFGENVCCLRSEQIFGYTAAKRRPEAFAFRPLHQNDENHQQRDQGVKREQEINQNGHEDGQYRQSMGFVNVLSS